MRQVATTTVAQPLPPVHRPFDQDAATSDLPGRFAAGVWLPYHLRRASPSPIAAAGGQPEEVAQNRATKEIVQELDPHQPLDPATADLFTRSQERLLFLQIAHFLGRTRIYVPNPQCSAVGSEAYVHCPYTVCVAKVARSRNRWEFRVEAQADEFVRRAAEVSHRTLTDFVVEAAVVEADRVLGDRTHFVVEDEQWTRFVEVLDRPPQENPGLTKLFAKPSVFR